MQSNRACGASRPASIQAAKPQRTGLFSTTALIPAIAALAGGAMLLAPSQARAQTIAGLSASGGIAANAKGEHSLCLDATRNACQIGEGATKESPSPILSDLSTGAAGRSLLAAGRDVSSLMVTNGITLVGSGSSADAYELGGSQVPFQVSAGNNWSLSGTISDASIPASLEKIGGGNLTLSGDNSYSGGTTISAGILAISGDANLGAASGEVAIGDGATLAVTSAGFSSDRAVTLTGNATINTVGNTTFNGVISGTGTLIKTGLNNSTLILTGNNSYSGGTVVSSGLITLSSDANLGQAGTTLTLENGTGLNFEGTPTLARPIILNGNATFTTLPGTTVTLDGVVSGTGTLSLREFGDGGFVLNGANTYSGGTIIASLTSVNATNAAGLGTGPVTNFGDLSYTIAESETLTNVLEGSGTLTKLGSGSLTISGANLHTGSTTVSAGTLVVANDAALGSTYATTSVASGATLGVEGGLSVAEAITLDGTGVANGGALRNLSGTNNLSGAITLASASLIGSDAGTLNLTGGISGTDHALTIGGAGDVAIGNVLSLGTGMITKTGAGTLALSSGLNATGTTGGLLLSQGTLSLQTSLASSFGAITTTGSVIDYGAGITSAAPIVLDSNTTQLQVLSGGATQSGVISELNGPRPLEKIGGGQLTLSGINSYSGGTTISAGTLAFSSDANLGAATGGITIGNGALSLTSVTAQATNRAFNLTGNARINVAFNGNYTINGSITGTGSLSKANSGFLILTGANSYSGTTTVNQGVLQIGNGGTTGTLGTGAVVVNSTLILNRSDDITLANDLSGGGSLIQSGSGTLTLTGAKSYGGLTSINAGTLVFGGTSNYTGGGTLEVNGGNFTLGVDASFSSVTQANSTVTLGGRTLTVLTGNYSLNGGSITGPGTIDIRNNSRGLLINSASTSIGADVTINGAGSATPFVQLNMSGAYDLLPTITGANLQLRLFNTNSRTTISGDNSFGGGTVLSTGTAVVASDTALGTGTLSMAADTSLEAGGTGDRSIANAIFLYGSNVSIRNSSTVSRFTLSGGVSGSYGLTKTGAGTLILTGANSYTGGTTIAAGILQVGSGSFAGSLGTGGVTIDNGATLVFDSSASQTVNNVLSGAGSLTKAGSGTLTLTGANSFTGPVSLDSGALQLFGGASIGDTALITMASGTLLGIGNSETIGSLAGAGSVVLQQGSTLTLGGNNASTVFAGSVTGLGGLTKTGSGTFIFTGTGNFLGTTTISGGTLQLGDNTTTGAINGGPIVNNASLAFNHASNVSVNTVISGTGTLTKLGTNTLTLTGANSYSGGTTISAGTLQLGSGSSVGSLGTGGVTIASGATLRSDSTANMTIAGALAGSGTLVQAGTGTTRLDAAANSFTGTAQIFAGTLELGSATALGSNVVGQPTGTVELRGGSLHLASDGTYANSITAFTANGNILSTAANSQVTLTGRIGGNGTLRIAGGSGSVINVASISATAGSNSQLIVQSGTVRAQTGVLGLLLAQTSTLTQVDAGATLDFGGRTTTIARLSGAGTLVNGTATTTLRGGNFAGALTGSQSIVSTGDLTLSGTSSYIGTTTVQSGTLAVRSNGALGSSAGGTTVSSGATLSFAGGLSIADALTVSGTGVADGGALHNISGDTVLTGLVTTTGDTRFASDSGYLVFNGGVDGGGFALTIGGAGSTGFRSAMTNVGSLTFAPSSGGSVLELQGTNLAAPVTANGGFMQLYANALASTASLAIGGSGNVQVAGDQNIADLSGTGRLILNGGSLTIGNANGSGSFSGEIQTSGSGDLTKVGTGIFTLFGTNSYTGATTISGGALQIGDGGTTGTLGSGAVAVNGGARLILNRSNALTLANVITGAGIVEQAGGGTLTLTGSNSAGSSFTGTLNVNSGNLVVNGAFGDVTNHAATVNIAAGASLGGTGTIHGDVVIANGGAVGPGNSPGTQTIAGNLTLNATSILNFELAQAGVIGGGINDLINVGGDLTLDGTLNVTALAGFGSGYYRLFNYGGTLTDNALALGNIPGGYTTSILTDIAGQVNILFNDGATLVQYWDGADLSGASATANGGAGTWSAGSTNWTNPAGFDLNSSWAGQTGVFAGASGGAVTIAGTQAFQQLQFRTNGYVINGGGGGALATTGGTSIINVADGLGATINAPIQGGAGLTKTGLGTLTLGGTNSYSGATSITAGTLVLSAGASLAGGVDVRTSFTNGGTVSGLVTNGGTLTSTGTLDGGLVNQNGGSANLSGTLDGAVINSGAITLTDMLTGVGAFNQTADGTLDLGGFSTSLGSLAGSGSVLLGAAVLTTGGDHGSTEFDGTISGAGALTKVGTGTLILSGVNSYSGLTRVSQGVLAVTGNGTLGSTAAGTLVDAGAALALDGGVTVTGEALTLNGTGNADGGALRSLSGNSHWAGTVALGSDSSIVALADRLDIDLLAGTTQNVTLGGAGLIALGNATTAGRLTLSGTGSAALLGDGDFAAGIDINAAALFVQGGSSINDLAHVSLSTGGLVVGASETIGSLSGSGGTVQINTGQTLTLGGNGASTSFAGTIFHSGNLVKQGTGVFTVTGLLAHSGTTTILGGTLLSGAADIWSGNGTVSIGANGTLDLGGFAQTIAEIELNGGTLANGSLSGLIRSNGGTLHNIDGTNNALIADAGVTTLTGTGSYAQGVMLAGGDVTLAGSGGSIADTALVSVDSGTLTVTVGETVGALSGTGGTVQIAAGQTLTSGGSNASTGYAGTLTGAGSLVKTGTGTLILSGVNTLTGTVRVDDGVLALAAGASLAGTVQNDAGFSNAGLVSGLVTNGGTLMSTGTLDGGLVNTGDAAISNHLNGAVENSGLIQLLDTVTGIGSFSQSDTGRFDLAGFDATLGDLSGAGSVVLGSATLTLGGDNGTSSFGGTIGGTGGLIKTGTGTFTLTGGQGYTGLTTVSGGTLAISADGGLRGSVLNNARFDSAGVILGSLTNNAQSMLAGQINGGVSNNRSVTLGGNLAVLGRFDQAANASLDLAGFTTSLGSLSGGGGVALDGGTLMIGADDSDMAFDGAISGAGTAQKLGGGTLTLTGANTISGLFAVGGGTLVIAEGGSVGRASPPALADDRETAATDAADAAPAIGGVLNQANLVNNGTISGQLVNIGGATAANSGTVTGLVSNEGSLTSTGTLGSGLANSGIARISGVVTGEVANSGAITLTGVTAGITLFQQDSTASLDLGGFDTRFDLLSGAGTVALGNARLTTGTDGVAALFSGVISGTGALTKVGTGGLILDGDNRYSGGTVIAAGSLQLGNGGTTGSIIGPVLNNGALIVNRSDTYTLSDTISGTGMLVQAGSGTTTLTGTHSYSGGTLISNGRMIGSAASLQGLIQNDATLEFAQGAVSGSFTGRIGGTGTLEKSGSGLLDLIGDNSGLTGGTLVRSGELRVTGSLAGSVTTLMSGARLSGNGVVGGVIAQNGSLIAPGADGLGVLSVNGAVIFQPGSALQIQIHAATGADQLLSNGTMQLAGGLAIANLGGTYAFNSEFLLVEATGGRTGTFDTVTGLESFGLMYLPTLVYSGTQVRVQLAPNLLTNIVGTTALTRNQRAVVARIDAAVMEGYNPQPLAGIYNLPAAQLPGALDQLSGEVYATTAGVGVEQQRLVGDAIISRVADVAMAARGDAQRGTGKAAWGQLLGSWGTGDGDGNAAHHSSDRQGFLAGIDLGSADGEGSWRAGLVGLYTKTRVSIAGRGSRAEVEQAGGGVYAGFNSGAFGVATGLTAAVVNLNATRDVALPGLAESDRGKTKGSAVQGFARVSYDAINTDGATIRPFARATLGSFKLDALSETGGAAALTIAAQRYTSATVSFGTDAILPLGKLNLSGTLAGRAQLGDRAPAATVALAAAPGEGTTVTGVQFDRFALTTRFDVSTAIGKNVDVSLGYTGLIGKNSADHGARASLTIRF